MNMLTTKVRQTMSHDAVVLPEPLLEFGHGQRVTRPTDGLSLFGPCDRGAGSRPGAVTYATVGTPEGLKALNCFLTAMRGPVAPPADKDPSLWPTFPGFDIAFSADLPESPAWSEVVDRSTLLDGARLHDKYQRTHAVAESFLEPIRRSQERDEKPQVIVVVVPDEVWKTCRPQQRVTDGLGEKVGVKEMRRRIRGDAGLFDDHDPMVYKLAPDFRRQLKARMMDFDVPVQIVRESTLALEDGPEAGRRGLTPLSDRMWNLSTALYYKAGGKPWRLATAREGVCYVGIAFRLENAEAGSRNGCCAAQMFLDDGDGVVFLGKYGPWYAPERKQFHLTADAAQSLLAGVLSTYEQLHGKKLKEVFLHSRSGIDAEEFAGYRAAVDSATKLVAVRVRTANRGIRLFREGNWPVLRGTFLRETSKRGYLWGTGFKPELRTYDGSDVPRPLILDVQHGDADITQVAGDILGLSKLNYNACKLGDREPVTVAFSDAVGEILMSNPGVETRRPQFRFYV
jgi:hypothetical protein